MAIVLTKESIEHFQSKSELYEAAIRNGWYLPKRKSSIVSEEYITEVICGKYYCPKFADVGLLPCPKPPSKRDLVLLVNRVVHLQKTLSTGMDEMR